jgi:hypothetical protein
MLRVTNFLIGSRPADRRRDRRVQSFTDLPNQSGLEPWRCQQVRPTVAIGGTEARDTRVQCPEIGEFGKPFAFHSVETSRHPYHRDAGVPAEVIDMPVGAVGHAPVVCDPGPETTRASGAAHVEISACLEALVPQGADRDPLRSEDFEQNGIGPRGRTERHAVGHISVDSMSTRIAYQAIM